MDAISFRCAACKQVLKVAADKAGRKVKCTKCGKELTVPKPSPQPAEKSSPAAPAVPAATETKSKQYSDDEDDDGAAYTFIEPPKPVEEAKPKKKRGDDDEDEEEEEEEEEEKKKPKPVITRKKLKKKSVQFADEWMKFKIALMLVFSGMCGWLLIWVLHMVLWLLGLLENAPYGMIVDRASQAGGGDVQTSALTVSLLGGVANADLANVLFIIEQVVVVLSGAAFLGAFCVCLGVPNRFGTKPQAIALVFLSAVNLLLNVVFRLLPALGAIPYVMIPLLAPEAAMNEANIDRVLPIHAFWCGAPFWEHFAAIIILMLFFAEPIMFCIFMRAAALSMKDDEWLEPRAMLLLRLGFGQFFIVLAYALLSLTGSSGVLCIVLYVTYLLWRGFLLGFLIWYAIITFKAKARVEYLLTADEEEE